MNSQIAKFPLAIYAHTMERSPLATNGVKFGQYTLSERDGQTMPGLGENLKRDIERCMMSRDKMPEYFQKLDEENPKMYRLWGFRMLDRAVLHDYRKGILPILLLDRVSSQIPTRFWYFAFYEVVAHCHDIVAAKMMLDAGVVCREDPATRDILDMLGRMWKHVGELNKSKIPYPKFVELLSLRPKDFKAKDVRNVRRRGCFE